MTRRDLIALLVVAFPLVAPAQVPTTPVIGFLSSQSPEAKLLAKFRQGLNELGYFEGQNIRIEYRWAHNKIEELPALAADLVQQRVALIATAGGLVAARAAKATAPTTTPIVFISGLNPAENGFVASLSRPGGNITGVYQPTFEIVSKRVELLQQIVGKNRKIAYLMNDNRAGLGSSEMLQQEMQRQIVSDLGLDIQYARSVSELEAAFGSVAQQQGNALVVASHPFFLSQRALIVGLAERYALPAIYARREFAEAGGLVSYGPSIPESWFDMGRYAGRILQGAQPQDLPIIIQNRFELLINKRAANTLGLAIPRLLLADETIE